MKLYGAPQSRTFRALWMLEECNAKYERVLVDIRAGAQNTAAFHAINPMEKVPALVDGETAVAESGAICAYLAERYPEADLAPGINDPMRGRYFQWLFFAGNCLEPAVTQKVAKIEVAVSTAGWGSHEKVVDVLDEALADGPWLLGERFSAADVMIGADLNFLVRMFGMIEPRPAFESYIDRCTARPAFRRAESVEADWKPA
ncbi:glutathione S-transferase family protein [Microbaculum marinum]|uniref:Glutathione S-transferase family protein n=1 Tax=Microbaculum marinum TaxID=1764581 RepID=A0AAW9RGP0_9HYPH